jgi:hypothetical protein
VFVTLTLRRYLIAPEEEDDSNEDDLLVQEDSDVDTEETRSTRGDDSTSMQIPNVSASAPPTPTSRTMSHGAAVAATRGLQVRTGRQRHMSQPPIALGLPVSPRPIGKFPPPPAMQALTPNTTAPPPSSSS